MSAIARGAALLRHDVRLQYRSGVHAAYLFVAVSYIVMVRMLPQDMRALVLAPVLLSEASVVGFFFAGALLHLERSDGVLQALGVTPVTTLQYIAARALTLTGLAVLLALGLGLGSGTTGVRPATLAVAAALTALFLAVAGLAVASRFDGIDRFVVLGGLVSAGLGLPVLPYLGVLESPLWRVLPTDAALRLLAQGLGAQGVAGAGSAAWLLAWCAAAAWLARRWLDRYALGRA